MDIIKIGSIMLFPALFRDRERLLMQTSMVCRYLIILVSVLTPICAGRSHAVEVISPKPYQRTISLTGFTRARNEVTINSEVSGKCLAVYADVGERIPPSAKFAQIDDVFVLLDLKANLLEQNKIKRELQTERRTLDRYKKLKELKAAAQAKVDQVSLSAELHELSLLDLENNRTRLNEMLKRHTISAPAGWHVIERMIEPGEFVQKGTDVVRVGDFEQLVIPFSLSYKELLTVVNSPSLSLNLPDLDLRVTAPCQSACNNDPFIREISVQNCPPYGSPSIV